jgi:hypothetical protein
VRVSLDGGISDSSEPADELYEEKRDAEPGTGTGKAGRGRSLESIGGGRRL